MGLFFLLPLCIFNVSIFLHNIFLETSNRTRLWPYGCKKYSTAPNTSINWVTSLVTSIKPKLCKRKYILKSHMIILDHCAPPSDKLQHQAFTTCAKTANHMWILLSNSYGVKLAICRLRVQCFFSLLFSPFFNYVLPLVCVFD